MYEQTEEVLKIKEFSVLISLVLAGIDQLTKWLVVQYLKPVESVPILKFGETEWINLTYCENTGMSFSMLEGQRAILIILPIILIGIVEWYIFSGKAADMKQVIALACLAGGGLGNLVDRVLLGYVVDFIDFRIINFAIFNFADICAVLGGIFFAIFYIIAESKAEKEKKLKAAEMKKTEAPEDGNA